MQELVDKYFEFSQPLSPLLHRPTFEAEIRSGLHHRSESFGAIVLLVCALGAKQSDNPAVLPSGINSWHWAGWQWFEQVRLRRKLVPYNAPTVHDLQVTCVRSFTPGSRIAYLLRD